MRTRPNSLLLAASLLVLTTSPLRAQTSVCSAFESQLVSSGDLAQADHLGASTAISGDVLVLGAPLEDAMGGDAGAAYVFRHDGTSWVEEQKLFASDGFSGQHFGRSVAVDGDVLVVGSPGENCQEAAYVYRFDGTTWIEEAKLTPSSAGTCNRFGQAVDVDGDVVVVGAERADISGGTSEAGAAFVYRFDGVTWSEEQKLVSGDIQVDDGFGHSVAVDGDRLVVGITRSYCGFGSHPGAVYSFGFQAGVWVEEQKLVASNGSTDDFFGDSVSLDGDTLAVGAPWCGAPGAVYVFTHDGVAWGSEVVLAASDAVETDRFGAAVSLDGGRLVAGAPYAVGPYGVWHGAAYLFELEGAQWTQSHKLLSAHPHGALELGEAAALDGDRLALGCERYDQIGSDSGIGLAYDLAGLPSCPGIYGVGKVASPGCVPTIGYVGSPSATAGYFLVRAENVVNLQPGFLVYGEGRDAVPFLGGTLCIAAPLRRAPVLATSFGSTNGSVDCTGYYRFPMNWWIGTGNDPALVPGARVCVQYFFRDPGDPFGTGLTDALGFFVNP